MEQKVINNIYQNGFYLLAGAILGGTIMYFSKPTPIIQAQPVEIHVVKDSVKVNKTKTIEAYSKLTESNLKKEIRKNKIPHGDIVLAQAKLETGNFQSSVCKSHNNLFGLRKGKRYRRYNHWNDCVKDYSRLISSRYKGGNYYTFLDAIGYAEDPEYTKKLRNLMACS